MSGDISFDWSLFPKIREEFDQGWPKKGPAPHIFGSSKFSPFDNQCFQSSLSQVVSAGTACRSGSNNDGVWNEVGSSVKITVVPPFWQTWWFLGLVVLVLVGAVLGGYRLRVRGLEARSRELESQVDNRTKELAALNAVAAVASRSLDLQRVLTNALDKTLEVLGVEAGGIYLLQADTQVLTIAAYGGMGAEFVAEIDELRV